MAKPMLVTFPALLLLLDAWPLRRLEGADGAASRTGIGALVLEKLPLVALSTASVAITFVAQRAGGAVSDVAQISVGQRVANAFATYLRYLELTIWPSGLAVFYPHPATVQGSVPLLRAVAGAALVVGGTVLALRARAKRPWVLWGWLWYLGTLVPVIGLVQVGAQAMADRYTYVPLVGVFVVVAWTAAELVERLRVPRVASALAAAVIVVAAAAATHRQVSVWRDSVSLHSHAVRVTESNWKSLTGLSDALSDAGRYDEAIRAGEQAVRIYPSAAEAWASLGATYGRTGRHAEAVRCFRQSLTLRDDSAAVWYNLGTAFGMLGDAARAADCFVAALRLNPDDARAWANLGIARLSAGDLPRAAEALDALRRLDPQRAAELKALIERAGG
jgi:tetratricopeptide (TPR) repeat protein